MGTPQLAQVAAYFAGVGASDSLGKRYELPDPAIARLVNRDDPARNSCHARNVGGPIETPVLTGQHQAYVAK